MLDFLSSSFLGESVSKFVHETGFAQLFLQEGGYKYLIMIAVGCFFLYLAIKHKFEPMLLVPIGFGIIIGNIPMVTGHGIGIYEEGSVLNYLYFGVRYGVYPPLIFLGVGAMTDFSSLISNPKLMLIGAAAQIGIFAAYMGALALGFPANEAGSIAIIGGADGPTAIFLTSRLAPEYMGAIAICAYSYSSRTGHPAARDASADLVARTPYQDASAACRLLHREDSLPDHRFPADDVRRA